ncbi:sensor histidine kinase [Tellurirhabdus bombi]|uniref:sensor histidine kinase n=1 Tax=Tellurirhabdus bombi TaxID=2907205 RepID=UPI001F46286D|nr:HAMP domain-containing sensor histidine kinase [Tellurirhabdus bombi]
MNNESLFDQQSAQLATFFFVRRESLLNRWRLLCNQDATLLTGKSLSREEFNDQIPTLLTIFDVWLRGQESSLSASEKASEHGMHRWHKGYALDELLTELEYLQDTIKDEIKAYLLQYTDTQPQVTIQAFEQLLRLINEMVRGSVWQYNQLYQLQAASRAESLQHTLDELNTSIRQRGEHLRMSTHDLRGSFGTIEGAVGMFEWSGKSEEEREETLQMLVRALAASRSVLMNLTDLARLEAGQETVQIESFDVGTLLRDFITGIQPLAEERKLTLTLDCPETLTVESDPVLVLRIIQNLVNNALKYTPKGWISVSVAFYDESHWTLSVQDSGPGLTSQALVQLASKLDPSAESSATLLPFVADTQTRIPAPALTTESPTMPDGEGIGLMIVKRLCELLHASMDIETQAGKGTLFRIKLLRRTQSKS